MIHVQTGHGLDVVYTYRDNRMVIVGLKPRDSGELIPLTPAGAEALKEVLAELLEEIKLHNASLPENVCQPQPK